VKSDNLERGIDQRAKRRRGIFVAVACVSVGGLLFISTILTVIYLNQRLALSFDDDVRIQEQKIIDAGQPLTLEELDDFYPTVPEKNNAALIYDQAFSLHNSMDPVGTSVEELYGRLITANRSDRSLPELRSEIASYLGVCKDLLRLLNQAATRPNARYVDPSTYYSTREFDHWESLLRCAKLEALHAVHLVLDDRQGEAVECHRNIAHMAKSLWMEPLTASQYYRVSILMVNLKALEAELNIANLYPETLASLEDLFAEPDSRTPLIRGLAGDRCVLMNYVQSNAYNQSTLKRRMAQYLDSFSHSRIRHLLDQSEKLGLQLWYAALMEQAMQPSVNRLDYVASLKTDGKPWKRPEFKGHPTFNTLASVEYMAMDETIARLGRLTIAIEKFHEANATLPPDLGFLVPDILPELPWDPYDGLPIRYIVSNQDYMVYSVFLDRLDDGGASSLLVDEVKTVGDWGVVVVR
jgi:hypothetical protein